MAEGVRSTVCTAEFARQHRLLCATIEIPAHGEDCRDGEPEGLPGWAARLQAGEDIVDYISERVSAVITHLVDTGRADAGRIFLAGGSRGAFLALHCAKLDERVGAVVALSLIHI